MTDRDFDKLIENSLQKYGDNYIDDSDIDYTKHRFSSKFKKNMKAIMKENKSAHRYPKITFRRMVTVAVTAAVIVSSAAITVAAQRDFFSGLRMKTETTHTEIRGESSIDSSSVFDEKLVITADMGDFELTSSSEDVAAIEYIYNYGKSEISYHQNILETYSGVVNTENAHETDIIDINGADGFYVDMVTDSKYIGWVQDGYYCEILVSWDDMGIIDKNRLIEIAKSVKKVEN